MERNDLTQFLDSKILIILKNSYRYTGRILEVGNTIMILKDKFSKRVTISLDEISNVEVLDE